MEKEKDEKLLTPENFNIDEEIIRFNNLEKEVVDTITLVDSIINMLNSKNEVAKGASSRIVALVEQKIGLLMRKESIIKAIADLKKNAFTINLKINESVSSADNDIATIMADYTRAIKQQQKEINDASNQAMSILNKDEVDQFFSKKIKKKKSYLKGFFLVFIFLLFLLCFEFFSSCVFFLFLKILSLLMSVLFSSVFLFSG